MAATFQTLSQIATTPVERISTRIPDLDRFFGKTDYGFCVGYGLPRGGIVMLAGTAGVGKSRLVGEIAANINSDGLKVVVFQGEARLSAFKGWGCNTRVRRPDQYLVSDCKNPAEQVEAIRQTRPDLVIIDSVNVLENCNYSDVKGIMESYIKVVGEVNCAMILIGQLDDKGKVRGSLDWTFLPDIVCLVQRVKTDKKKIAAVKKKLPKDKWEAFDKALEKEEEAHKNDFSVSIPQKNRYGTSGVEVIFTHVPTGVNYVSGNVKE